MDTRVIVCESLRRTCNYLSAYLFIYSIGMMAHIYWPIGTMDRTHLPIGTRERAWSCLTSKLIWICYVTGAQNNDKFKSTVWKNPFDWLVNVGQVLPPPSFSTSNSSKKLIEGICSEFCVHYFSWRNLILCKLVMEFQKFLERVERHKILFYKKLGFFETFQERDYSKLF